MVEESRYTTGGESQHVARPDLGASPPLLSRSSEWPIPSIRALKSCAIASWTAIRSSSSRQF
eukprot:3356871-Prorocentrum_lima.AAC.1